MKMGVTGRAMESFPLSGSIFSKFEVKEIFTVLPGCESACLAGRLSCNEPLLRTIGFVE